MSALLDGRRCVRWRERGLGTAYGRPKWGEFVSVKGFVLVVLANVLAPLVGIALFVLLHSI